MTAKQIVEMALGYAQLSKVKLAESLGWSPQLLNKRLNTGKLSVEEWEQIGKAMGAECQIVFRFPDGKEIS